MKIINFDDFEDLYKPLKNHLDDNASLDGTMFETYGEELDYVLQIHKTQPERVWTYTDGEIYPVLTNNLGFVNRIGYVITEVPFNASEHILVDDEYRE